MKKSCTRLGDSKNVPFEGDRDRMNNRFNSAKVCSKLGNFIPGALNGLTSTKVLDRTFIKNNLLLSEFKNLNLEMILLNLFVFKL